MSVALNGSTQFLDIATPKSGFPFSVSFWFKTTDVSQGGANATLVSNDTGTSGSQNISLLSGLTANYPVTAFSYATSWSTAYQVSPWPANNTWHHVTVVWTSSSSRHVLLDGASKGTGGGSQNTTGISYFSVGARFRNTPSVFYSGSIAEVVFYGSALSDANAVLLASGTNPQDVDAVNILGYWTLYDDNSEELGGTSLTEHASPTYATGDHPTISAAAGTTQRDIQFDGEGSLIVTPKIIQYLDIQFDGEGSLIVEPGVSNINHLGYVFPSPLIVKQPDWDLGCDQGSITPWDKAIPTVLDPLVSEGIEHQVTTTPMDQKKHVGTGIFTPVETPWFEHAHMLPRVVQNVGNVVTEQSILCELYNADRKELITVSSITDNLGVGFQVIGVPATPFNIASQDSLSFSIKVLQSGDFSIDGEYTMTLSTGEEYTIYIIGSRIVLLPVRPEAPLKEHLIFDTKIIDHVDASEQRIMNRKYPRSEFEMRFKGDDRKRLELLLFDRQSKVIAVPAWHEPAFLGSAGATVGTDTITVNTTDYANFFVGGYAVILQDEHVFDALKIDAITATTIQFSSNLANSYSQNTQVLPLMTAYTMPTTPMVKAVYNDQDFNVRLKVHASENDIASADAFSTYNGKTFLDDPNLVERDLKETLETKVYVLDNGTGDLEQFAVWDHAMRHSRKGFKTNNRQELWELRQLFHYLKGRQVSLYIPTFSKDLVPNQTLLNANSTFTMDHIGYTVNAHQRWPKQVFRMHLLDGTILVRTIQGSAEVSGSVEQLTVDLAWPYDIEPEDIERVEFLEKIRLDTDDIIIVHHNALGESQSIVATKEVSD